MFRLATNVANVYCFPFDQLQVEHKDRVEHGDQKQRDERSNSKSSDLGIAQWLPQRSTFHGERKEREDRCSKR